MFNGIEHMIPPLMVFDGMYMAEVIDNVRPVSETDPSDDGSGRVKVRVFPMMTGLEETVLPWAIPAFGLFEGGSTDAGAFTVPAKNSKVWVFFAVGDVRSPVYFAAALGMSDGPVGADPEKKIWKSRSGHTITVSDKSGEELVEIVTAATHKVTLDDNGNTITIEHKDGEKIVITDSAIELGKGTLKTLINQGFKALFDAHQHAYVNYPAGGPPVNVQTSAPAKDILGLVPDPITPAMITVDTKAS